MVRVPSLLSLRAFEAVARYKNIAKAADELCVTRSAVSQQVKQLEDCLQLTLIDRSHNKINLTDEAKTYAEELTKLFQGLGFATQRLLAVHKSNRVTLNLPTTYAMYWLIPKMQAFQDRYPEIDLCLSTPMRKVNFDIDDIDLAIAYGDGSEENVKSEMLFREEWIPVCAPAYLSLFQTAECRYIEVKDTERQEAWRKWCEEHHQALPQERQIFYVSHTMQAIQAALNGLGLACVPRGFVEDDLAGGRLVLPFGQCTTSSPACFYLLSPERGKERIEVQKVKDWLLAISHS